jgi:hypothetical protein
VIDGARYRIALPRRWNGTLLLYSHGYRFAAPGPPNFGPVQRTAQVSSTDSSGSGTDPLSKALLRAGYALAGSSYKTNGWAVADGVRADSQLHQRFVRLVGRPQRTYVWGDSLGGLITELVAEQNDWVSGAAPMCGAVAGPLLNFDAALDVAFAVKTLIDPALQLTGYRSAAQAGTQWKQAAAAVEHAATNLGGGGTAKVLFIAALVNAPLKTKNFDGHGVVSRVEAAVEALLTALAFGTSGRYEVEQRVGGNASANVGVDYTRRVTAAEAALVSGLGGNVAAYEKALERAPRVSANRTARAAFERLGDPSGALRVPTVTLHTEDDPLVLVQNESVLRARVARHHDLGGLTQLYIAPPRRYTSQAGAPYGAGHCAFSDRQRLALIATLDREVRTGHRPAATELRGTFGPGLASGFNPGPWPAPRR